MPHPELDSLRARIDAINAELRALLQERARVVDAIAATKRARGLPAVDEAREAGMLAAIVAQPGPGFDAAALTRIFAVIFRESRARVVGRDT